MRKYSIYDHIASIDFFIEVACVPCVSSGGFFAKACVADMILLPAPKKF